MAYTKTSWANSPSTTTPINATNLNKIENGIENVSQYITATAATNGDFKINISSYFTATEGSLFCITFPAATTNTQNARFSINDGTNYYNIVDNHGLQILALDLENAKSRLVFDGTNFIAVDFKNYIVAFLGASSTSSVAQYSFKQAVLNTEFKKCGKCLTLSNGFIKNNSATSIKVQVGGVMNTNNSTAKNSTVGVAVYTTGNMGNYVANLTNVYTQISAYPIISSFSPFEYILPAGYALGLVLQNQQTTGDFLIYGRSTEMATYLSVLEIG